jgi:transcriptional regulator NrdR family protein
MLQATKSGSGKMEVSKKSGTTEVFMPEKVVVSAVKCGCSYDIARDIASSLSSRSESSITSSEIREFVLSEMRSRGATSAADSWESYDSEHKT